MILIGSQAIDLVMILAITLVAIAISYLTLILVLALRRPARLPNADWPVLDELDLTSDPGYEVIVLMPCLNEEKVLGASLKRLLELPHPRLHVLVVDDGSDDGTADVVRSFSDSRVHLLQRSLPDARKGKGAALNAGYRHILQDQVIAEPNPQKTIVVVVDADGRLEHQSLHTVLPAFDDPTLGGVQIGVRINNRTSNVLARMQDVEFTMYTEVYQRGRRHLGSVGLGGNGQFVRLSALMTLRPTPWSSSLCEDLDMGVRLHIQGWRLDYCSATAVHQQGLEDIRRWVKQRTRWFQGHLQSWGLVPEVLESLKGRRRADLLYHLTSPFLLLASSLFTLAFVTWILQLGINLSQGDARFSWTWITAYVFAFIPMLVLGMIYRRVERRSGHRLGFARAAGFAHLYVLYAALWYIAGWKAVWRMLRGQTGWSKTDRIDEAPEEPQPLPQAVPVPTEDRSRGDQS